MGRLERKLTDEAIVRARLKLGRQDEPTISRRTKPARAASSYRGARRNKARAAPKGDPLNIRNWRKLSGKHIKLRPHKARGKTYPRIVRSPAERRLRATALKNRSRSHALAQKIIAGRKVSVT